jgi:hypothetical protein
MRLLRCSRQRCGVNLEAGPQELGGIQASLRRQGQATGTDGPL